MRASLVDQCTTKRILVCIDVVGNVRWGTPLLLSVLHPPKAHAPLYASPVKSLCTPLNF